MEVLQHRDTRLTLPRLPLDVFRLFTPLITIYDVYALWITGSKPLQLLLGPFGAIQHADIPICVPSVVRAPFGFFGHFSQLKSLCLSTGISRTPLSRMNAQSTDLSALPKSLTSLSIQAPNVLELLYDRSQLSLITSEARLSAYQAEISGSFSIIRRYKLNPTNDRLRVFYDLDELFPKLSSLELREVPTSKIAEDDDAMFGAHSCLPADFPELVVRHFMDDESRQRTYPSLAPPKHTSDHHSDLIADDWLQVQLLKSLPKSLSKLVAILARNWEVGTLSHYLPPTVTDLYVRALSSSPRADPLHWPLAMTTSEPMQLPATLRHLRVNHWTGLPLGVVPSTLETLETSAPDLGYRRYGHSVGSERFNLEYAPRPKKTSPQLFLLPQLAALTGINLNTESVAYSLVPPPDAASMWPKSLTSLNVSVEPGSVSSLLASIAHLPLEHLGLSYNGSKLSRTHNLSPDLVEQLPKSLTSMALTNLGLMPQSSSKLPSLTKLMHVAHVKWLKEDWTHDPDPTTLPPSLTDLCITITGHSTPLSSFFQPSLRRLSLNVPFKRLYGTHAMNPLSEFPGHLTELKINTDYNLDRSFCSLLPRSLLRLSIDHGKLKLSGADQLPERLEYLTTDGALFPLTMLPPNLKHLQFSYPHASGSRKKAVESPEAVVQSWPRSLTFLYVKRSLNWDARLARFLPPGLRYCRIEGADDAVWVFRTVEALYDLKHPSGIATPISTPTPTKVDSSAWLISWILLFWSWLMSFFGTPKLKATGPSIHLEPLLSRLDNPIYM